VVVITRNDIEKYGYSSVQEILENVLGFYKIDDYRNLNYGVRGFYSNVYNRNIIIMVNGIDQKIIQNGSVHLKAINLPVAAIDKIEIIRGPMSVIYGNDAFFGAINIITNDISKENGNSIATVSYGSENTENIGIRIGGKANNITYSLVASYKQTEGRNIPFSEILDSVQSYDGTWKKDATTKDFFKGDAQYIGISADYKGFYSNLTVSQSHRNLITSFRPLLNAKPINYSYNLVNSNIGWKKEISKQLSFRSERASCRERV